MRMVLIKVPLHRSIYGTSFVKNFSNSAKSTTTNTIVIAALLTSISNVVAAADTSRICTKNDQSLGIGLSSYTYEESEIMSLEAKKISIHYALTYAFDQTNSCEYCVWFIQSQLDYANGKADYQSPISGTINDTPNWYINTYLITGKDFHMGRYVLSPHIGIGIRYLHNDLRTNDIRQGYRRHSKYTYIPIGITHKTDAFKNYTVSTTVKYLYLVKGVQDAKLSDQNSTAQDVRLHQPKGYGLQIESMLKSNGWAIGPTVNYWKINQSNTDGSPAVYEPKNNTLEFGFKLVKYF